MRSMFRALTALVLGAASVLASAHTLDEIHKAGTIVMGTDGTFPPFQYFEGEQLKGFEIDLGDEIGKRLGVKVQWKPVAFDSLLAGLRQDRWDLVIASTGITPDRAKAVDFANPHYCTGGVVVAKDEHIKSVKDLIGKTVAAQTGSTYFEAIEKVPGIKQVRNFASDNDARNALVAGRADAWVTDKFVAREAMTTNPALHLHMGDFVFTERIATAVKKGNTSVFNAYNKALAGIMADGTYERLSAKWFHEDIRCKS